MMTATTRTCAVVIWFLSMMALNAESFTLRSTFLGEKQRSQSLGRCADRASSGTLLLTMRDLSATYWFQIGEAVLVVGDVVKANHNLRGRQGVVTETWEKCDVDPTCCCAEQVDLGMAVRVYFMGSEKDAKDGGSFEHYFAEDELVKMNVNDSEMLSVPVAFDGMSCRAFKLEQLQIGQKPRSIASFEPISRGGCL
jgi:hypothetical protein